MSWVEVFVVFVVSHLVGDFLLQTDRQALHKFGGLGRDPVKRSALFGHVAVYALCFVPAGIWIGENRSAAAAVGLIALVVVPHLVQDDGRLIERYVTGVKGAPPATVPAIAPMVDQSFHALALFGVALLAGAVR
jgi:hypothetical protein